jgi:hypothetical protein
MQTSILSLANRIAWADAKAPVPIITTSGIFIAPFLWNKSYADFDNVNEQTNQISLIVF